MTSTPPSESTQKRPQAAIIAVIVIAVIIAGALLFAFLNRGSDSGSLTGRTWQLAAITGKTPAYQGVIPPAEQPLHTITFATDGTFAARADCNVIAGTYTLERGDGITITPGASTLVACPDGSYGTLFAHHLGEVTTWVISEDDLTLTTSDGGTGTFVDSATALAVPTATASLPPTLTPSASPSAEPTPSPSPTPTASPSPTAAPTATQAPTQTPTATPAPTETPTATPAPTETPTATPAPTETPTATPEPTAEPTDEPEPDSGADPGTDAHPCPDRAAAGR